MTNGHQIFDYVAGWIATFSIINVLLPPYEYFDGYPRFQSVYKLIIKVIGYYGALNLRGTIATAYNQRKANSDDSGQSTAAGGK